MAWKCFKIKTLWQLNVQKNLKIDLYLISRVFFQLIFHTKECCSLHEYIFISARQMETLKQG